MKLSDLLLGLFLTAIDWVMTSLIVTILFLAVSSVANGAEAAFVVTNKCPPAFKVANKMPVAPAVAIPARPFIQGGRVTTVPSVVAPNTASPGIYRTGNTFTSAPTRIVGLSGPTSCPTFR